MNELNPTNAFGELLLDLIDSQYGGDYDAGIAALVEATGLAEEEVVAIVQGETIVDDESLLSDIVGAFPDADDDDLNVIINVATEVDEEDRAGLIEEIGADLGEADEEILPEEEMVEEVPEEELAGAYGYRHDPARQAYFSLQRENEQLRKEVKGVKNFVSNFQAQAQLSSELKDLDREASSYVDGKVLPPAYKAMLVGNFSRDEDRVARFSKIAQDNGVDIDTMLFATKYALGMLKNSAEFMEFRDFSMTEEDAATANFSASLDEMAKNDLNAIFEG